MYGAKSDILNFIPAADSPHGTDPINILLGDSAKLRPWEGVSYQHNHQERLVSQRNITMQVINKAPGPVTKLIPQNELPFSSGLTLLPNMGLWGGVTK